MLTLDAGDVVYIHFPSEIPAGVDGAQLRTVRLEAKGRCQIAKEHHELVKMQVVRPPRNLTRNRHKV